MKKTTVRIAATLLVVAALQHQADAGDWLRFRGPNGIGISHDETPPPVEWSPTENVKWKVALPGAGVSSPIIVGDRVFVTCFSGYGGDGDPGNMDDLVRHLVCVDRNTGDIAWQKAVPAVLPEDPWRQPGIPAHGYASHTPVSDGQHVYVFFGKTGVIAYDLEGNQLWQKSVGTGSDVQRWGSSSSPILMDDLVVVVAGPESRTIYGLNAETGEEVWSSEAEGFGNTWGTPAIADLDGDEKEIVIGTPYEIWGLNPANGKLRWYCEAGESEQFSSSVVTIDGIVYSSEGRGGGMFALKAGGRGDVTEESVLWSGTSTGRFGSPVVYDGRMYVIGNNIANCFDASTGERVYQGRLQASDSAAAANEERAQESDEQQRPGGGRTGGGRRGGRGRGGQDYSSPVSANGMIYYVAGNGVTYVIRATDSFDQVAANRVTDGSESFGATPAISDGAIYLRSDKHLYCVAGSD